MWTVTFVGCPAPLMATPSRPSGPRVSGTIAPPVANGIARLNSDESPPPANRPSKSLLRPPTRPLPTGLTACVTAMPDNRKASCLSTSSKCLPPAAASVKALLMALANTVVLTPSILVLSRALSTVSGRSPDKELSVESKLSIIRISLHQFGKCTSIERCAATGDRLNGVGEFAWCHAPELFGREPQHTEAKADRLLPGKRRHPLASPKVAAISAAAT